MLKKTLFVAVLSLGIGSAIAQPAEQPTGGLEPSSEPKFAPPSDEKPDTEEKRATEERPVDSTVGGTAEPTVDHGEKTLQPGQVWADPDHTKHFNWFGFSYRGKDQYGGNFGDGKVLDHDGNVVMDPHTGMPVAEEPMSAPFVLMVLNFVILLGILLWKGRPAARQMAAERHDLIKTALDEAAKLRDAAAKKLEEYETKLKAADDEIKSMVEGMRKDAEADKARILANAERQSAQMKKDAEARIAAEIELARAKLTREVTAAAASATEKLLREKMQPADQQKLVASFISDVTTAASSTRKERV
ncbi:MAG: ATP synthase F0 subunit B [Kofleriaceae bacterium]|nr:ATP synthase F0 subunit B [Kofleriaceae bacterium]